MKHAIVTGGTGVSGVALVRFLLKQGIKVTALIRPASPRKSYLPEEDPNLHLVECDMEDYRECAGTLAGKTYDAFFHLAWVGSRIGNRVDVRNDMYLQNRNITYMLNAVELCHILSCPVFIATGSQAEYGRVDGVIDENAIPRPDNGYGSAKLCAKQMTRVQCKMYGIKHVWARLFSVYGPYDGTGTLIDGSIRALMRGENPPYTEGRQLWDYLYSYDAAKALYLLAEKGKDGESYGVANGTSHRLCDYIATVYQVVAPGKTPLFGALPYRENQVMSLKADITKLKETTGFEPEYTFEQGIRETYAFIQSDK